MDLRIDNPLSPALLYVLNNPRCKAKLIVYDESDSLVGEEIFTEEIRAKLSTVFYLMERAKMYEVRKLNDIVDIKKSHGNNHFLRSALIHCVESGSYIPEHLLEPYLCPPPNPVKNTQG